MSSSKSLFDILPPPKSATNYGFKPKTAASNDEKPATSSTIVKPPSNRPLTNDVQQPMRPRSITTPIVVPEESKYSSNAIITSKPVPNTSTAKSSKTPANYSKIQKVNFFGIESYGSDEDEDVPLPEPTASTSYYSQNQQETDSSIVADILKYENRKRRHQQDQGVINIVDVNINDVIEKNKEQQIKNLTSEPIKPARKVNCAGRKAAQITNLAMLAKEREKELNHQWSESKFNRKLSKQKYGF